MRYAFIVWHRKWIYLPCLEAVGAGGKWMNKIGEKSNSFSTDGAKWTDKIGEKSNSFSTAAAKKKKTPSNIIRSGKYYINFIF